MGELKEINKLEVIQLIKYDNIEEFEIEYKDENKESEYYFYDDLEDLYKIINETSIEKAYIKPNQNRILKVLLELENIGQVKLNIL
ncbi:MULTISPECIES: hypothetical protein [unclassified Clostridium]|uniref:hypothetical protein n=1 Tax=unclassified Clostridium TaxID=2614128 RepID=UPI0020792523|nr:MULTISPECIES: hypothetical protein [unclassified Clostridium]